MLVGKVTKYRYTITALPPIQSQETPVFTPRSFFNQILDNFDAEINLVLILVKLL